MKNICLRLANRLADGAGAQVQRHLETIALASFLNASVCDGVIVDFDSNPGDGIKNFAEKNFQIEQINLSIIPRYRDCHKLHNILESRFINYLMLNQLRFSRLVLNILDKFLTLGKLHFALNVHNTAIITRRNPLLLENLKVELSARTHPKQMLNVIRIVAHIHGAKNLSKEMESRFIQVDWFVRIISETIGILKSLGIGFNIEVHTDIPSQPNQVWKQELGLSAATRRIWLEEGILSKQGEMKLVFLPLEKLFAAFDNLHIVRDIPPTEVLHAFRNADILITNKSSLSFVGGFLNEHGMIVCTESWLPKLKSWHLIGEKPLDSEIQKYRDELKEKVLSFL